MVTEQHNVPQLWTEQISKDELTTLMQILCTDVHSVFGLSEAQQALLIKTFATLWSQSHALIVVRMTNLVRKEQNDPQLAGEALQQQLLTATAVEMGKLALSLRPLKGKIELVPVAGLMLWVMTAFSTLHLIAPTATSITQEERVRLAKELRANFDIAQWQRALETKTLPGLSAKQNSSLLNYKVKRHEGSGKIMLAFMAACILLIFFAL